MFLEKEGTTVMVLELISSIFMAGSLIFGIVMIIMSLGLSHKLRKTEIAARFVVGLLLLFSVYVRLTLLLWGPRGPEVRAIYSMIFDTLYISIAILFNLNLFKRLNWNARPERDNRENLSKSV